jgi:hypothetical protein
VTPVILKNETDRLGVAVVVTGRTLVAIEGP